MKINILGTEYSVEIVQRANDPSLEENDGYCDETTKRCVVESTEGCVGPGYKGNIQAHRNKVVRHEIIHAFLYESGLAENCDWAASEAMVDWLAIQLPRIMAACLEAGCI